MNRPATRDHDRGAANAPKSIAQIEGDIERIRGELDRTLNALGDKLAGRRLMHRGVEMIAGYIGAAKRSEDGRQTGRRVSPIALGLIGAGIAWLVADYAGVLPGTKPTRRRGESTGIDDQPHCTGAGEPAKPEVSGPANAQRASWLDRIFESNPLVIGLLGLIAGTAASALLPPLSGEREFVGRTREDLWQKAEDFGHRAAARIRGMADRG